MLPNQPPHDDDGNEDLGSGGQEAAANALKAARWWREEVELVTEEEGEGKAYLGQSSNAGLEECVIM